ncbi:aminoglycoside phosphotransferase [Planotetraspora thailandica]|uniref:Aminoglycoside phosphotransferase n=1 Tax=Planotetraspora thailandica TaxID=487172 RepID=A0A8J4DDU5_9ACTN|nr:phosphotransferase [Planotetraspora thailandica]GII58829.1 aminoglycoside phosphotransferase [Planotetraspora thailandica]
MNDQHLPAPPLIDDLVRLAPHGGPVTVLKDTRVLIVRVGDVVIKAHPPGTGEHDMRRRLEVAGRLPGLMLAPLDLVHLDGRIVTIWPAGRALTAGDLESGDMPWEEGGWLLAGLHAAPLPADMPPAGGPDRAARAVAELAEVDAPAEILKAYETLPEFPPAGPGRRALTHGDWHLGQLVFHAGAWLLIDPDDLGAGDPVWDLARPAAWFAAGLLEPDMWHRFLSAYLSAGGSAVSREDPWRELDLPARALTVQLAATATVTARRSGNPLDETAEALIASCGRIVAAAGATREGEVFDGVSQVPGPHADVRPQRNPHRAV